MIIETGIALAAAVKVKEDSVLGMMYKDVAQPSVQTLGKALGDVFNFCTTPILLLNYGTEVAKLNYKKHLDGYQKKIESITEDERIPVNPQVGIPIIDKLTYTTNEEIADLFTSLLAKASSSTTVNLAHPAFIQIIERLSVDEARLVKYMHGKDFIPCVSFRAMSKKTNGFDTVLRHGTTLHLECKLLFENNVPMYLENLISLGILDISHGFHKMDDTIYQPLLEAYNYEALNDGCIKEGTVRELKVDRRYFQITNFGELFIKACN